MTSTPIWLHATCLATFLISLLGAAPITRAQTVSVVYNFGSVPYDPNQGFYSGIITQGQDGNLYSGASGGGAYGYAATFNVTPTGILTPLYSFADNGDGAYPYGGLTLGTDGLFYGTTYGGGFANPKYGTVFKMTSSGGLTTLYTFTDGSDGALPIAPPVEGIDGNFYGTTCNACNGPIATGFGTIYKITPTGTFTVLHQFTGTDGYELNDPLVLATDGNFYGTTTYGGPNGNGNVFRITPSGSLTILYNLDNSQGDGEYPIGRLVQGNDGNFYGTTVDGGPSGYGVVFKITPAGNFTVLYNMNGTTDGSAPYAGLVQAADGNFYGANANGGAPSTNCPNGCGTIFKITPGGVFSVLYNFDLTTGQLPYSTLFQHTNGLIYGMTQSGGTGDAGPYCSAGICGVVYGLNIGAVPFVTFVVSAAKVGGTAEILGQGFTGTAGVSFNGTAASFTVVSDTYITATVPIGATTGPVRVITPAGPMSSNVPFRVLPKNLSPTTTKLTTSGSPSLLDQPVTFTATITSSGGLVPDGEAIAFYDGTTQIGLGSTATGKATLTTSSLSAKTHIIKAIYAGDSAFKTSSGTVKQIVELSPTTTSLSSSANPSNFGQIVTLTAVVANSGGPAPTGTVTFKNGVATLGSATLVSPGTATLATTKLPLGSDLLTADYNGDSQNQKSTSSVLMQAVNQAQITLSLASSPNPSSSGKLVKFTATLTSNGGLPNGQIVSFSYNSTTLGTAKISAGKAIFSTTALPSGSDQVSATFAGTADYSSASDTITQTVN
jgi:uncharacterized repeat protein (TIGR03803 family)